MEYDNNYYRTTGNQMNIEFLFVNVSESIGWRAYILSRINYGQYAENRCTSAHLTHRVTESDPDMKRKIKYFTQLNPPFPNAAQRIDPENDELCYICWTSRIQSLESIKLLAATWSEITAYYIKIGGTFEVIQPALKRLGIIEL